MPPNTAATKALIAGHGSRVGGQRRIGGAQKHACDGGKGRANGKGQGNGSFTLMPIRVAAPLSSDTASIACPALVLLIKAGETEHDDNAGNNRYNRFPCDIELAVCQAQRLDSHHRGKGFCVSSENQKRYILQKVADADSRNQNRQRRGITQGLISPRAQSPRPGPCTQLPPEGSREGLENPYCLR